MTDDKLKPLYCLHELSSDDVHPAPDRATAQLWAAQWTVWWHTVNKYPHEHDPMMTWRVSPWPWDTQSHADGLAKSIEDNTFPVDPLTDRATDTQVSKLVSALDEVLVWLRNWDLPFDDDDDWIADKSRLLAERAALDGMGSKSDD